jgi:hypothetical protein
VTDGILDDLLLGQVGLVPDEELVDALGRVAVDLLEPLLDVGERVLVGDVVDDDDAMCAAVWPCGQLAKGRRLNRANSRKR